MAGSGKTSITGIADMVYTNGAGNENPFYRYYLFGRWIHLLSSDIPGH